MIKRRDFLKLMGGALGAVVLTSCGDSQNSDEPPIAPIPNGYLFYKIISSGDPLPDGNVLGGIPGSVMINNAGEVYFYGMDQTETNGFYELLIDFNGSRPTVVQTRKVVREGDVLEDSKEVVQINMADTNRHGSFAATVQTHDNLTSLYLERGKQGLEPIAGFLTTLPGGGGKFGASFGDLDLHDDDDILIVSHFAPSDTVQGHQGVFYLPFGEVNQQGGIVASTRDQIPGTDSYLAGIGLIDMHDNGNYIMQAYGSNTSQLLQSASMPSGSMDAVAPSILMGGNVIDPYSAILKSASPAVSMDRTSALIEVPVGEIKFGPRIGSNDNPAFIVNVTDNHQVLYHMGKRVLEVGTLTPLGNVIVSFSAPVIGHDGLLYCEASTENGLELMVYNGSELRTILAIDDLVEDSVLKNFLHGFMPDQVDDYGRIVLTGDFEDGSTSIIIGIPI